MLSSAIFRHSVIVVLENVTKATKVHAIENFLAEIWTTVALAGLPTTIWRTKNLNIVLPYLAFAVAYQKRLVWIKSLGSTRMKFLWTQGICHDGPQHFLKPPHERKDIGLNVIHFLQFERALQE